MSRQITRTAINSKLILIFVWVVCLLLIPCSVANAQRVKPSQPVASVSQRIKIAILPFRNAFSRQSSPDDLASVLGDGIADSLTNSLKREAGLDVVNTEIVLRTATRFPADEIGASDENALRIADSLSVQIIVVGSYQLTKDHLHVDARILFTDAVSRSSAQPITADGSYPGDYSAVLTKLLYSILINLKRPLDQLKQQEEIASTWTTLDAHRFYLLALRAERDNTLPGLSRAIDLFNKALSFDRDNAEILAGIAEAEMKLYKLKLAQGDQDERLADLARGHGLGAVKSSPNSGRAYNALADAQAALGDNYGEGQSRIAAKKAWPGDTEIQSDLARSFQGGKLVRSDYTDRAFLQHPELGYRFPQLPKILVRNDSQYRMTIRLIPDYGRSYPPVVLGKGASRLIPIFPGHYHMKVETEIGALDEDTDFKEGQDYDFQYSSNSFPIGTFTFVNDGGYTVQIRVSGHPSTSLALRPDETRSITMPAGAYTVTARVLTAVKTETYELSPGGEEKITYSYTVGRVPVSDPAELIISNFGNAPFTATINGPKRYRVSVPPGSKTITVTAGDYRVLLTCGGDVTDAGEYQLAPDSQTTISEYGCKLRYRYIIR